VVTAKTQYNLKNAREYFEEHLCVGDYYNEWQRVAGEWIGVGAGRLTMHTETEKIRGLESNSCLNRAVTISG
jgi:hypothetical protein